jgi:hypothetical protein
MDNFLGRHVKRYLVFHAKEKKLGHKGMGEGQGQAYSHCNQSTIMLVGDTTPLWLLPLVKRSWYIGAYM